MLAREGAEAAGSGSPKAFKSVLAKEVELWEKIVKMAGFADSSR